MDIAPHHILELIPHAPPFAMVNALTYSDELTSSSVFYIADNNCMVTDGLFTEGGLLENMAQTAAARAGYIAKAKGKPVQTGYIGAVKDFEVHRLPPAGSQLITEITVVNQIFNVSVINGKVWCNDLLAASCEMKLFLEAEDAPTNPPGRQGI